MPIELVEISAFPKYLHSTTNAENLKIPDPADVPYRAAGLDLQSRPIEYKDLQSARQQCTEPIWHLKQ